jgi:8-oxo-dGTP pyrophosphatase MutT (NUDIX family)
MNQSLSEWLTSQQASVDRVPVTTRVPLFFAGLAFGTVEAKGFAAFAAMVGASELVSRAEVRDTDAPGWHIVDPSTLSLNRLASAMRQHQYGQVAHLWRGEQLAVRGDGGKPIATVERGAVRALGITTHGVHLHGCTADRRVWIQQRAPDKKTHPGRWDTLMGGMVSAADTLQQALARETAEEAGLALTQLNGLRRVDHFTMRCPNAPDSGLEYMVERIDWFECVLPDGVIPVNTDGEVQQFQLVSPAQLEQMLLHGAFTPEAGLILGRWLLCRQT